ncbi:PilW family protein [Ectothiorhodospira lacustris]|uniref:PilW family protein n=1 Tax=Ectothiorhodospira lacustris TaxID=2899127 RepID=UPI001EE84446|nr:PilW family protein [Ectothiorhodospira lacustris]MCG5501791.1 PilW family protein [Ectothiorhodospira lacustris]
MDRPDIASLPPCARRETGLSLVELMVAMVIALIITAGIIQLFLGTQQTYRLQQQLSVIQENARFATDEISHAVRMAGFVGCVRANENLNVNIIASPAGSVVFDVDQVLDGLDNVSAGTTLGGRVVTEGTDLLIMTGGRIPVGRLIEEKVANANAKLESNVGQWKAGDILIISDCESMDIFRATNVSQNTSPITIAHASSSNTTNFLSKVYEEGADVMSFLQTTFFISQSDAVPALNALWRRTFPGQVEELVTGVENMQIQYGVDTNRNGVINLYRTADQVTATDDWPNVLSIRISLLLASSADNTLDAAQTVYFNGAAFTAEDRRVRQVATTTIAIRNRLR